MIRDFQASGMRVWAEAFRGPLVILGFLGGSDVKECNEENLGLIPGLGGSPGEGNATHSSILAWRIPWMEEPGGLQSIGSQRVRQD